MQNSKPIAFYNQAFKGNVLPLSTYKKKLYALVMVMQKWRSVLLGNPFVFKTDHQSLKYLFEQKKRTPMQHKYISKLLGYDLLVEYKKGQDKKVVVDLSRRFESELPKVHATFAVISSPTLDWLEEVELGYTENPKIQELFSKFQREYLPPSYTFRNGLVLYKQRFMITNSSALKQKSLHLLHTSLIGGLSSYDKTMHRVRRYLFFGGDDDRCEIAHPIL